MATVDLTRYAVPGWGTGQLWMRGMLVLAHDFRFSDAFDVASVAVSDTRLGPTAGKSRRDRASSNDGAPNVREAEAQCTCGESLRESLRTALDKDRCLTPGPTRRAGPALATRFAAFLAGDPSGFDDVALDLGSATAFQRAVVKALRDVPRGEVVSYGELAALAGHPRAARAVGTFCATNRFAFVVPCHRVVAADGLGGYGSAGVGVKRRLLELEGRRP